jgi:hypothetical protein
MKLKIVLSFLIACMSSFFQGTYSAAIGCGAAIHQPIVSIILGVITFSCIAYGALKLKEL